MRKSSKADLIHNMSAMKYSFHNVCETALDQLNHYFCTVGNGMDYDPKRGLIDTDSATGKNYFIAEKHDFDLSSIDAARKKRCDELNKEYQRMTDIFGDKVPSEIDALFSTELAELQKPFLVLAEIYYFSYIHMAREMVELVRKNGLADPHSRLHIRTPYPLSDYSIISGMTRNDNPLMVELALVMSHAWVEVLQYYIESEWYYTVEEVEQYGGASYYYSLTYIKKCIDDFKRIITNLEIQHD